MHRIKSLCGNNLLKDQSMMNDGTPSILRNGRLGRLDRFTMYLSNNIDTATDSTGYTAYYALFGTKYAITFASQIVKMESLRAESTFGDLVRGLQVYGYKVIKPECLGYLYVRK
jgi:hypothetical protein